MFKSRHTLEIPVDANGFIYRPWITTRDGRRIYAKDCGLTAFKIPKRY
jgi:hypothetical protein